MGQAAGVHWAHSRQKLPQSSQCLPCYLQGLDTGTGIINLNLEEFIILLVLLGLINVM